MPQLQRPDWFGLHHRHAFGVCGCPAYCRLRCTVRCRRHLKRVVGLHDLKTRGNLPNGQPASYHSAKEVRSEMVSPKPIEKSQAGNVGEHAGLLKTGLQMAGKHVLVTTLGILSILLFFTFTIGLGDNVSFLQTLLSLLGISLALFFTFSPKPSVWRGFASLVLVIIWVSLLMDAPFKFRSYINRILSPSTSDARSTPVVTLAMSSIEARPASGAAAVLPRPPIYQTVEFANSGPSINVGCGESATSQVSFTLPPNAQVVSSAATWVDTNNIKGVTGSASTSGGIVTASGTVTGVDPQNFGFGIRNCPGGGHARLMLKGEMRVPEDAPSPPLPAH